jgi:hypothetical protein
MKKDVVMRADNKLNVSPRPAKKQGRQSLHGVEGKDVSHHACMTR